jgi:cbb3-type cytochrome oxidase subunit 3
MVLIPLILFFVFFLLLLFFITRPKNKELFKKMEKMPLEEEESINE